MVATAELFKSGNSMAVQIPKGFLPATPYEELLIKKTGSMISIFPKSKRLELFLNGVNGFSNDFMKNGRGEEIESPREVMS
jgi:antitoxin VapB